MRAPSAPGYAPRLRRGREGRKKTKLRKTRLHALSSSPKSKMLAHEDNRQTAKAWKELMAQHGQRESGQQCLDWCEQPPRKKAKAAAAAAAAVASTAAASTAACGQPSGGQSHKVVEKRRRDRMNQAISSLSRLIPSAYLKQGQSRVEKAEIIELAAQHLLGLTSQLRKCQSALGQDFPASEDACCIGKCYQGFRESSKAAMTFLTEQEGFSTTDTLCCRLRAHLHMLSQKYIPSQAELSLAGDQQRLRASQSGGSASSTDEAPQSCGGSGSSSCDGDHSADGSRGVPKSAFKQGGFQAESEAAAAAMKKEEAEEEEEEKEQLLPGFVLHESGTHYLPLVVPPSALGTEVCSSAGPEGIRLGGGGKAGGPQLLHPVSIPVNFRATRFVTPRVRVHRKPAIAISPAERAGSNN